MQLALRTEHIPFSSLCAFFDAAEARQRAGQDIINMVMGRPDFLPAPHINEAVKKAVDDGQVHYTSNYGLLELRQEVARKLKDENGLGYAPETEIVITAGVSEALHLSMAALLNPGDEALIPAPAFLSYGSCVHMASRRPGIRAHGTGQGLPARTRCSGASYHPEDQAHPHQLTPKPHRNGLSARNAARHRGSGDQA